MIKIVQSVNKMNNQGSRYTVAKSPLAPCFCCGLIKLTLKVAHIANVLDLNYPLNFRTCIYKKTYFYILQYHWDLYRIPKGLQV